MLVKRAEEFAKLVHRNQYYLLKSISDDYGELPYYVHLKEVYLTLLDFGVTDENILAASWLHDSIEDYLTSSIGAETTYETLLIQFGKEVADLVLAVTNEQGTNRKEILEKTALKIVDNEAALVIKLADRIVNTEFSIDNNEKLYKMYEKEFPRFRELLYSEYCEKFNYTLEALWMYLEHLYLEPDERLSIDQVFDRVEQMQRMFEGFSYVEKDPVKCIKKEFGLDVVKVEEYNSSNWEELDEREARYYDDCYQIVEEKMYDL